MTGKAKEEQLLVWVSTTTNLASWEGTNSRKTKPERM